MKYIKKFINYFTLFELLLWCGSMLLVMLSFTLFDRENSLNLIASLIGVTSLIFCAKGNPAGNALMVVFSLLYGYISYTFSYFGEMITYLGMTLPMSVICLVAWLRNPYNGNKAQVKVNSTISKKEHILMWIMAIFVTAVFYFILEFFNTANLIPSTVSITTSFVAVYLCARRSPYFTIAYAANDVVLIVLWVLASLNNTEYISVAVCFIVFLINDIYGFIKWLDMAKKQGSRN